MKRATISYRHIAAELRRRIESGVLSPSTRAPSTRALAKRFGVANATAARALRLLIQEQLLKAVPRSGTIVLGQAAEPDRGAELCRERIIAAGIEIADHEGVAALSVRGVAARLGVSPMSLYRHVESKDALVALMIDAVLGEEKLPAIAPGSWRAELERGARLEWQTMRRHPWVARVMNISRPSPTPNAITFVDWVMHALDDSPLDAVEKLEIHIIIHSFIQGLAVNVEAEAQAAADTGLSDEDHMQTQEPRFFALAASGRFPYFAKMLREVPGDFELDHDRLFERGLKALLDGIALRKKGRK